MDTHFEDHGTFYANQDMVFHNLVLSVGSGLVYDVSNMRDVKIARYVPVMIFDAKDNIADDSKCWSGEATVLTDNNTLIWEY